MGTLVRNGLNSFLVYLIVYLRCKPELENYVFRKKGEKCFGNIKKTDVI